MEHMVKQHFNNSLYPKGAGKEGPVKAFYVHDETFAFLKMRKTKPEFLQPSYTFACVFDKRKKEMTAIVEQDDKVLAKINEDIIDVEPDFKLITFDMDLPFTLSGFIANISNLLSKNKIPIAVISSFSTDHLLLKKEYINEAVEILKQAGFKLKNFKLKN